MDGNFVLDGKSRGIKNDPPLGPGWGSFVEPKKYEEEIAKHKHDEEVSFRKFVLETCL